MRYITKNVTARAPMIWQATAPSVVAGVLTAEPVVLGLFAPKRKFLPQTLPCTDGATEVSLNSGAELDNCNTITELDLRVKRLDPDASIRVVRRDVCCPRCNGNGRPRILALAKFST